MGHPQGIIILKILILNTENIFLSIENNFLVKLYLEFHVSFANNSF